MKKATFILFFLLALIFNVQAQRSGHGGGYSYHRQSDPTIGLCVTGGGLGFTLIGFMTPATYNWVQTSPTSGQWNKAPFMKQGARSMCIATGFTLTITGLITILAGR